MAIGDIALTAGMRANLVSLQQTEALLNRTQDRLSTGKKVNSSLDDPVNFFAAQSHTSRASGLSALKDAMSEAIQTVKAADAGIKAITALIDQAKSIANSARATATTGERATFETQYDAIRTQIDQLALDSSYKGVNLLTATTLKVNFNEAASSSLTITGVATNVTALTISAATGVYATGTVAASNTAIDADIAELTAAKTALQSTASSLSSSLNVITARQEFTTSLVNALVDGANKLTLADVNEEGANLLALQTRQALSTTSLSLSAQAAQSVLRLF